MRENKEITSREQVIAAAQRQEELAEQQSKKDTKPETKAKDTPASSKRSAGSKRGSHTSTPSSKGKSGEDPVCYNCGKPGHKKNECKAPPKDKSEEKDQTKKGKPKA
jgi:hypothetical protein